MKDLSARVEMDKADIELIAKVESLEKDMIFKRLKRLEEEMQPIKKYFYYDYFRQQEQINELLAKVKKLEKPECKHEWVPWQENQPHKFEKCTKCLEYRHKAELPKADREMENERPANKIRQCSCGIGLSCEVHPTPTKESKTLVEKFMYRGHFIYNSTALDLTQIATDHFKARFESIINNQHTYVEINWLRRELFKEGK